MPRCRLCDEKPKAHGGEVLNGRSSFSSVGNKPPGLNHRAVRKDPDSPMLIQNGQNVKKYIIKGKHESQSYKRFQFDLSKK